MAIDELSQLIHLPMDNVPGAPPPEDTPNEEPIDPQKPDRTCTPAPTNTRAHRQVGGLEHAGGKHMAEQLDGTISIASSQNDGIHGILFSQHMTFIRLNHSTDKCKGGSSSIGGVHWATSNSNHFNLQMLCENSSLKSILGSVILIGLKIIFISPEHYTTGIFSNVFSSFGHISHFRRASILNQYASQTVKFVEYTVR
jgi:hypothetical protein